MSTPALRKHFYKILTTIPPTPLPSILPAAKSDVRDGFIHFSTAKQCPKTADMLFSKLNALWILKIDTSKLDGEVKYEEKAGPGCPHLYRDELGIHRESVKEVFAVEKDDEEVWSANQTLLSLED